MLRDRFWFARERGAATDATAPGGVPAEDGGATRTAGNGAAAGAPAAPGRFDVPRTRGLVVGLVILVLGVWGGIVAFIGPYFHYAFINHQTWHWTMGRLWLEVIPAVVAIIAGLELMRTRNRASGVFASWLAVAAGTWFIVGQTVSTVWNHGASQAGRPLGSTTLRMFEQLGFFFALGAAILFFGALALARFSAVSAGETVRARPRAPAPRVIEERDATASLPREPVAH